jgi:two-component system nitrogen regulation response regulator GlnG
MAALTVLWHADISRVGERALLANAASNEGESLSRFQPLFGPFGSLQQRPLADTSVSRQPLQLRAEVGGVRLSGAKPGSVRIDGAALAGSHLATDAELEQGVILELSSCVALVLHWAHAEPRAQLALGMVGESRAVQRIRAQITSVAPHPVPVLVLGESGTGKELVARALHDQSARRSGPFLSVSMAAVPPGTAAAALFGHTRGAFTGAHSDSPGHFGSADGGTLFLDEIGATPLDIQAALLRVIETGEVQRVGAARPRAVDVRIVAATDADLEGAVTEGRFLLPLLHRLRGYEIRLQPLRERREDIGRLLAHFLATELGGSSALHVFRPSEEPWLAASLVAEIALSPLRGNVRELRNLARRLLIDWGQSAKVALTTLAAVLPSRRPSAPIASTSAEAPSIAPTTAAPAEPREVLSREVPSREVPSRDEVLAALESSGWRPGQAARQLEISRTTLYALMKRWQLRTAIELDADQIRAELLRQTGDLDATASALRVSKRALVLRLGQLDDASLEQLVQAARRPR